MCDDDNETSEDEEPASPQSESSEGGDDDTGSGSEGGDDAEEGSKDGTGGSSGSSFGSDSDSGADSDSSEFTLPRKRTKRASRSGDDWRRFRYHLAAVGGVARRGEGSICGRSGDCPIQDSTRGPSLLCLVLRGALLAADLGHASAASSSASSYPREAPFKIPAAGGAPGGPSISTRAAGRVGRGATVRPRTKAGCTHVGSSSRALIPDDDESEAEVDSSEGETGDGSGSGSDDGADGDTPGPSSRKRTRTDSCA
ncbi:GPI-anchored CFEM domain protein A-like [Camellia sinensis]|uniref:GPI-anchored CFEM domain protein A-like n=1 Tax=Camellia sinensis TaxID=4442 RepID=UPI001035EA13|nr:GPI-anchored CFEM domain protein A-like [Camellia sinensis]